MRRIRWTISLSGLVLAATALADRIYLREADAPRAAFPQSTGYEKKSLRPSDAERIWLDHALGKKTDPTAYPYLEVRKDKAVLGQVFLLDVMGQSKPITFAVGVTASGVLQDVQVMVYREPHGEEIQDPRFRRQFAGKSARDPVALGVDVDAVSGATISSRSATYAARKSLLLADILRHHSSDGGK